MSDCCDIEEDESMLRQHRHSEPVARKEYTCCECRQTIPVGTRYHYFFGLSGGPYTSAGVWRVCNQCELDWPLLESYLSDECGRIYGHFLECLNKALDEGWLDEALESDESLRDLIDRWIKDAPVPDDPAQLFLAFPARP